MCVRVYACICITIIKEEIINLRGRRGDTGEPGGEGRGGSDVDAVLL